LPEEKAPLHDQVCVLILTRPGSIRSQALLEECREVERQEALAAALAAAGEQGIRIDALATLAGGETQRAREWIEEQQLAGAAYEQGGSYFPL
jgi:hypothetical protein